MYIALSTKSNNSTFAKPRYVLKSILAEGDILLIETWKIHKLFWKGGDNTDPDIMKRLRLPKKVAWLVKITIQESIEEKLRYSQFTRNQKAWKKRQSIKEDELLLSQRKARLSITEPANFIT